MRTAVNTNVLIDLLSEASEAAGRAERALLVAGAQGSLVLSVICYAEIALRFVSRRSLDRFVSDLQLEFGVVTAEQAFAAGKYHQAYLERGGKRERILPDFLVAPHALLDADRLLSLDKRFYGPSFPTLKAITPAELLAAQ